MLRKIEITALFVLVCCAFAVTAQEQRLKIVPNPKLSGLMLGSDTVRVDWVELPAVGSQAAVPVPREAGVYFSRTPAGGDLSRYRPVGRTLADNALTGFSPAAQMRRTEFIPNQQGGAMGPGAFYCIVAATDEATGGVIYSDYFTIMIESPTAPALVSPKANIVAGQTVARISELTPSFRWSRVDGVPYYHIILSDRPIVTREGSTAKISDTINVIWQAITPNTSIAYGAPDPSGTNTVPAPPLTPGRNYSWVVLNNYGNHMAFSSNTFDAMDLLGGQFVISGTPVDSPTVVSPRNNQLFNDTLTWTNIDQNAVSFLVNVFSANAGEDIGISKLGDITANTLIWEASVSSGGVGRLGNLSVTLDAAGTLTGGDYFWRVYAVDSRGVASTGANSVGTFRYRSDMGVISVVTEETLGGVRAPVGHAEIKTEVVFGSTQAPLAFFTGDNGRAEKAFHAGAYRITASKDGYDARTVTVNINGGDTVRVPIVLTRPEAALFGNVFSASGGESRPVSMAKVTAVSNWGDTVTAFTGGAGGFRLNCRAGEWTVGVDRAGYGRAASRRVTLRFGDNVNLGNIGIERNPHALTGAVRNQAGQPLIGARVRVLREGEVIDELASTPQSGAYVFYLMPGNYTLTAEKVGFVMFSRNLDVTGSRALDAVLREGATLVNGTISGRSWVASINDGEGGFVTAPVGSARVSFWDRTAAADTFKVTADPQFGRFSASLPAGRDYDALVEAAGFDMAGSRAELLLADVENAGTVNFAHTLNAFASIRGAVTAAIPAVVSEDGDVIEPARIDSLGGVNIFVYDRDGGRTVASARTTVDGTYEVRGIPNGRYAVTAGMSGLFAKNEYALDVDAGRPTVGGVNVLSYNFEMEAGDKTITWSAVGYSGHGSVNVLFPLNRTLDFTPEMSASLGGVGPGEYVFEAIAASDANLLQLSRGTVTVPDDEPTVGAHVYFPVEHRSQDTLVRDDAGRYTLSVIPRGMPEGVVIQSIELYYRSEGSARFESAVRNDFGPGQPYGVEFAPARDGAGLQYYFVVVLSNGARYGSSKQVFTTFVKPDPRVITRLSVIPEAFGDTLFLPSNYAARFTLKAFYGDLFAAVDDREEIGGISWNLVGATGGEPFFSGSGRTFEFTTPDSEAEMTLTATLAPSGSYKMKEGRPETVTIPVRVTGSQLGSMSVRRRGEAGPIAQTGEAAFIIEAFDGNGGLVSVSPRWSVAPASSGAIGGDGVYRPSADFFGNASVIAEAVGVRAELEGGQDVYYALSHRTGEAGADTANTLRGLRLVFAEANVSAGEVVEFGASVPELNNHVHKGQGGRDHFRMAGNTAFDVSVPAFDRVAGEVSIIMDIPEALREAARKGDQEFKIARWFPDSLAWIPIENSKVVDHGAAVVAVVKNETPPSPRSSRRLAASSAHAIAAQLASNARYATVTRAKGMSLNVTISPHPFSPFIRPVREYGPGAPEGTCVRVNVEAPETFVRSIKVQIHNSTGMRVWAVDKLNAETGENRFWWNGRVGGSGSGRSSVREEMWTESYHEETKNRPMARNGRYFVTVIVTDNNGNTKRVMKPVVLMK